MEKAKATGLVVDPYTGCGPVLTAAKAKGLKAIGMDVHEPYLEIAAKRLSQEVFAFGDVPPCD